MKNKGQSFFNILSIITILAIGIYFVGRYFYYQKLDKNKEEPEYLHEVIINTISKYEADNDLKKINNEYIYTAKPANNYIKYQGLLWRIIKINKDNTIKLISEDTVAYLPYTNYNEWLNQSNNKYSGVFSSRLNNQLLINTTQCISKFNNIEDENCFDINQDYTYGILSVNEYIKAGGNNSFLNNGNNFWTSNQYNENSYWYINNDGKISYDKNANKHGIRVVITLKENIKLVSGNGTYDSPYIIESRNIQTAKDLLFGEIINYNNNLWRVIYADNNKIKIASLDYIKFNNTEFKLNFSDDTNNITKNTKIINYLNTQYYQTLPNKEYLTYGAFYTGAYSLNDNDYKKTYAKYINLYVGILAIGEPFANELNNTYLITPSTSDDLTIYTINAEHNIYENQISSMNVIRPVLYLKGNVNIISGNGSINSPYILGGNNEN